MTTNPVLWPRHLNPYSFELRLQFSAASSAFKSLEARIAERKRIAAKIQLIHRNGGPSPLAMERDEFRGLVDSMVNLVGPILGDVQSFLAAVGVVSSILWPADRPFGKESSDSVQKRVAIGAEIRKLVGVSDDSILNASTGKGRDIRGGLLHFDEMMNAFRSTHPEGDFVSFDIGSAKNGTAVRRGEAVRWLDEDTLDLWVNGRDGNLRELLEELQRTVGRIQLTAKGTAQIGPHRQGEPLSFGLAFGFQDK